MLDAATHSCCQSTCCPSLRSLSHSDSRHGHTSPVSTRIPARIMPPLRPHKDQSASTASTAGPIQASTGTASAALSTTLAATEKRSGVTTSTPLDSCHTRARPGDSRPHFLHGRPQASADSRRLKRARDCCSGPGRGGDAGGGAVPGCCCGGSGSGPAPDSGSWCVTLRAQLRRKQQPCHMQGLPVKQ